MPIPASLQNQLEELSSQLLHSNKRSFQPKQNDHITLCYIPEKFEDVPGERFLRKVHQVVRNIAASSTPISAKLQGWAYFDGVVDPEGNPNTALVGLIDAPGLAQIHVRLVKELSDLGINTAQNHGFTPHTTFAYLPLGKRLNLPLLQGFEFEIPKFCLSNDRIHEFRLGQK